MKKIFISNATMSIYHQGINDHSMPKDVIEMKPGEYERAMAHISKGGYFDGVNNAGIAILRDREPQSILDTLEEWKAQLRAMRTPILDALSGIAGRASRAGNGELAMKADEVAVRLLDITDDPALNAAKTSQEIEAAAMSALRAIGDSADESLKSAFR
ncbi:MAG: putative tail assembly chaperone [Bacteriophage sp.]|nr:MAG: putative tail assembly chaperone [Bacteriophage sp.]